MVHEETKEIWLTQKKNFVCLKPFFRPVNIFFWQMISDVGRQGQKCCKKIVRFKMICVSDLEIFWKCFRFFGRFFSLLEFINFTLHTFKNCIASIILSCNQKIILPPINLYHIHITVNSKYKFHIKISPRTPMTYEHLFSSLFFWLLKTT